MIVYRYLIFCVNNYNIFFFDKNVSNIKNVYVYLSFLNYFVVKKIIIFLLGLVPLVALSQSKQEKIKGNKIVELKTMQLEAFTSIEVENDFNVELVLKESPSILIDGDSNLHEHIDIIVHNGKLRISTNKAFTRYKRLFLEVGVSEKLSSVIVKGKSKLTTKNTIISDKLNVETYDSGQVKLNFKAENASFFAKNKSEIKATGESNILSVNVNDSAEVEMEVTCDNFSASENLKSELAIKGSATNSIYQITDNSFLNAAEFITGTVSLTVNGSSEAYVHATDKLVLEAAGKTTTNLLGNPLINLKVFKDEASFHKTNKAPSGLKSLFQ